VITDLKPYPAYKDSRVEWLGDVPEEWKVAPARSLFDEIIDRNHPEEEMLSVTIGAGVTRQADLIKGARSKDGSNLDKSSYKLVRPGDIAYNKMRAWQGAAGRSSVEGIVSPAYIVMRSREGVDPEFVHRLLRIPAFAKEAERWSYGITSDQWSLRSKDFKQIYFPVPPVESQAVIARFLDYVESRTQQLIAKKERLSELLEERRGVIIHRAVTRGPNSDVALRPSGVDWLGDTPKHWEILDLGQLIDLLPGFAFPSGGFSSKAGDTRLLRGMNVAPGEVRWNEVVRWPGEQQEGLDRYRLEIDDLVLGLDRPVIRAGTRIARVTKEDTPSLLLQRVARIRTLPGLLPDFAYLLLGGEVFRRYMAPIFTGISVPHLSPEQVKKFRIGLPPLGEQEDIVNRVSGETERAGVAVAAAQRHITLLQELRIRLISDVVTGKLDVRKAAERLPDDPDSTDPALDEQLEEVIA
jgi:type I restriction enzyme S subunit